MDYEALAQQAEALIAEYGREVTIISFNTTPADVSQPWKGAVNPRTDPDASVETSACFVNPSSALELGISTEDSDLVKRSSQIMMVSPGTTITDDLSKFDEVIDYDDTRWKITAVETLKPAETTLLYFIGVAL